MITCVKKDAQLAVLGVGLIVIFNVFIENRGVLRKDLGGDCRSFLLPTRRCKGGTDPEKREQGSNILRIIIQLTDGKIWTIIQGTDKMVRGSAVNPQPRTDFALGQQIAACSGNIIVIAADQEGNGAASIGLKEAVTIWEKILQVQDVIGGDRCIVIKSLAFCGFAACGTIFSTFRRFRALGGINVGQIYNKKN